VNRRSTAEPLLWHAFTALVILGLAWAFYAPALAKTGGLWPAPLDDVYIHFGFARSAALGRPFQWIPGNGFSSGGTSLTYPLLLAPGYWLGFRGANMGIFAALLACACLFDLCRSARALALGSPRWVAWIAPPLLLAVPLLDWSLFSGMETALFYALLGRALVAVRQVEIAPPHLRSGAQVRAGIYCALLVATRPESVAVALPLGVAVAHAAGSLGTLSSLARGAGPTIVFLVVNANVNKLFTSEWGAAGAIRKLLTANPYTTPLDIAPEIVRNVVALRAMALESALGVYPASMAVPLLAGIALLDRRARRLAVPLVIGAAGALLLASLNATARFQNLRYASPSIAMLLLAALLGASSLASKRGKVFPLSAALLAGVATLAPSRWFPIQIDHFARSSANIAGQQVEVADRERGPVEQLAGGRLGADAHDARGHAGRDHRGHPGQGRQAVPVDGQTLQAVAEATGGNYFAAGSTDELRAAYADIGSSVGTRAEEREISGWFVGAGLVAAAIAAAMSLLWFSRLP